MFTKIKNSNNEEQREFVMAAGHQPFWKKEIHPALTRNWTYSINRDHSLKDQLECWRNHLSSFEDEETAEDCFRFATTHQHIKKEKIVSKKGLEEKPWPQGFKNLLLNPKWGT
jgi:hypothetical protein